MKEKKEERRPSGEPPVTLPDRKRRDTPMECPPPAHPTECSPHSLPPSEEIVPKALPEKREGREHAVVWLCVAISLVLTLTLMIGGLCLLCVPTESVEDIEEVTPSGEEERRVVWVSEYGDAESGMSTPELYDACIASVVSIRVKRGESTGVGSGFVWREDGYIATAAHVIDGSDSVEVIVSDGRCFAAETVGCDALCDLALLRIDEKGLSAVTLGSSSSLVPGSRVVAIGTPASLDYAGSVCSGEVSAVGREVKIFSEKSGVLEKKMSLIQMSAPVNPGNSGCPLFDGFGRVVGMVTMRLGQNAGIGFAVPSDGAADIWEAMYHGQELTDTLLSAVSRRAASLGIEGEAYEMEGRYGVRVMTVTREDTVLCVGDLLLAVGSHAVSRASEVEQALREYAPGDCVAVTLLRNGQQLTIDVILF